MRQSSILVIDDDPENFEVIEILLSSADEEIVSDEVSSTETAEQDSLITSVKDKKPSKYRLYYAANGQDALDVLDIFKPDLILLDIMMPGIDGIEVCRQIKAAPKWRSIPIIMVTALTAKSTLAQCLEIGADDFISKPINALELRARIDSMLRIKHQHNRLKRLTRQLKKQRNYIHSISKLQRNSITLLSNSLEKLRQGLATNLTQELNSPLRGVLAILTMLQVQFDDMSPTEVKQSVELATQSAHQLETLLQQILFYLYIESKIAKKSNVNLLLETSDTQYSSQDIISKISKSRARRAQRSEDLMLDLQDASLTMAEQYFSLIVSALVDNALKFSNSGTSVIVSSKVENNLFYLSIRDMGQGMTQEQIASIGAFTQFSRQFSGSQGLGLGLTLVQKIVNLCHGRLIISSVSEQGTTMRITLPINRAYAPEDIKQ
ncbi:MAG: hybrid sensor histidine kinase/response regulator [Cyanobacteria bacterium J06656_5]